MAMTNVNIRMDENLKKEFETIIHEMGFDMTTAFNVYIRAVVREKRIPFEIYSEHTPNEETIAAFKEIEDMKNGKIPKYQMSVKDFVATMEKEAEADE